MDAKRKRELETMLVEVLLSFRQQYLRTPGANTLENWRIVLDRMVASSRSSETVDKWFTMVQKRLQIPQLGKELSSDLLSLSQYVHDNDVWPEARNMIERERGLLEALGRSISDKRKEEREAQQQQAVSGT